MIGKKKVVTVQYPDRYKKLLLQNRRRDSVIYIETKNRSNYEGTEQLRTETDKYVRGQRAVRRKLHIMKKRILILLGILIIGGGTAGICWKTGVFGQQEVSGDAVYVTQISEINGEASGVSNRYAGVVEPQETVSVELENGRSVKEVKVKTGDQIKKGQLLFEYDLSSIQDSLEEAQLELDRLKNEASSLNEQIATLEKEKKKASQDNQLSYTIEIETNKMNLKKNEYNQKSKQAEIDKLQSATGNTEVRSSIDGVIQKIDTSKLSTDDGDSMSDSSDNDMSSYSDSSSGSNSNAFITILSTGSYRVKGTVNELNIQSIVEGEPVIIRSRVDSSQIWLGTMGTIDKDSATSNSNSNSYNFGMMDASGDSQTSSSTYPFYVELDSSDGLMLGQHVYIEPDFGQQEVKEGIWLYGSYLVFEEETPYVWAADADGRLKKCQVETGEYDENLDEYQIVSGLEETDRIAYPMPGLYEGVEAVDDEALVDYSSPLYTDMYGTESYDMESMYGTESYDMESMYGTESYDMESMYDTEYGEVAP